MPKLKLGRMFDRRENAEGVEAEPQFDTPDIDYSDGYDRPPEAPYGEADGLPPFDDGYGAPYPGEDGDFPEDDPENDPEDYLQDYPEDYPEDGPDGYPEEDFGGEERYDPGYAPRGLEAAVDYVMTNDWVTWVLLLVLPPLGIWLLWRRGMLNRNGRLMFSLLSGIWFVGALVLMFGMPQRPEDTEILPQTIGRQVVEPAEPTATPEPEIDEADAVYTTRSGAFYHLSTECRLLLDQTPNRVARSTAQENGLMSCPYCAGGSYGVPYALFMTNETTDLSNQQVYCSQEDEVFHIALDCPTEPVSARLIGLKEALLMNRTACPSCCATAAKLVWCTANGTYYHVDDDCQGMRNARQVTYAEARVLGKVRCPKCIGGTPEVNAVPGAAGKDTTYYVYATKNGAYYHIDEHCSGMQNAERVKLADMLASNRPACPVCCTAVEMTVFVSRTSPYYHSYSGCTGLRDPMSDTLVHAMATGLERCPLCWQTADQQAK